MKTNIEERADEVWLNEEFDCVGVESDGFSGGKVSDMLLKFRESEIKLDREERDKRIDGLFMYNKGYLIGLKQQRSDLTDNMNDLEHELIGNHIKSLAKICTDLTALKGDTKNG